MTPRPAGSSPAVLRREPVRPVDLRLIPAAVVSWGAASALTTAPAVALGFAVAAWLAAGAAVAVAILVPPSRGIAVVIALAIAAGGLVATTTALRAPSRSSEALVDEHRFEVVTTAPVGPGEDRVRGTVGEVPVLVVGLAMPEAAGLGAVLEVHGSVRRMPEGGSIAGILVADRAELIRPPPAVLAWAEGMRAGFRAIAADLPGDGGALLTGLAIGDDAGLPTGVEEAMTTTSLSHLTAVSGANCVVVVGAALLAAAALGLPRRVRLVVALLVLVGFVVLVTPQPSVVRAAVMAALALIGVGVDRPVRGVPLLALAVLGILAVDPWAAGEAGFVLSVLATGGLLLVAGPLADRLTGFLPRPIALLLAVPVAAQLTCQPAIVLLDPALPLAGVAANLLAGPAAPVATGLGLLACLVAPVAPPVAVVLAWAAWVPSTWIAGVATVLAAAPMARMPWPVGGVGFAAATIGSAAVIGWAVARGRPGRVAGSVAVVWAVVVAGVGAGSLLVERSGRPDAWTIAQCDVGQGDAVLLRSAGAVALVDTGPDPGRLSACLDGLGVDRIDLLVLTHFDADHVGGVDAVVGRVDAVLIGPVDDRAGPAVIAPLLAGGARVEPGRAGLTGVLGAAAWRVLWPSATTTEPGNAASLVLRFETSPSILLLGDLGAEEQRRMLASTPPGEVAVVKVSHHGSADRSDALLTAIAADVALIGVGVDNGYGHPAPDLLAFLADTGTTVVRSDEDGLALLAPTDDGGSSCGGPAGEPRARRPPRWGQFRESVAPAPPWAAMSTGTPGDLDDPSYSADILSRRRTPPSRGRTL